MTETVEPVSRLAEDHEKEMEEGVGIAISGGGYRAMLFHLGSFLRLFELNLLDEMRRISSVSGGSITSAKIALELARGNLTDQKAFFDNVVTPIRALADTTIDAPSIIGGVLLPGSVAERVSKKYRDFLSARRFPPPNGGTRSATNGEATSTTMTSRRMRIEATPGITGFSSGSDGSSTRACATRTSRTS